MTYSKTVTLLALFLCSAPLCFADALYAERHRPQIHFSPVQQWMNDPNGMVYYDGEYHLFYQYHPYGNTWGPMHWGHAVSEDLVHWEHLPVGLFPDRNGAIWSGSAVVDHDNTTGFGTKGKPPLVAVFTQHDHLAADLGKSKRYQSQGIAYSLDNGRNWQMYENNPVLKSPDIPDFRDPKVFWYEPDRKWVMSLAVRDHIRFYSSPDLKSWEMTGSFGGDWGAVDGVWECPDLIELEVEGEAASRWVLLVSVGHGGPNGGSGTQYFVGDFNGKTFTLDPGEHDRMRATPEVFPKGMVFEDFNADLANWSHDGDAFLVETETDGNGETRSFLSSGLGGEAATGVSRSKSFEIASPYINFRLSGRDDPDRLGMRLVIEGQTVRNTTGDRLPRLQLKSWDVREFIGKTAVLEIFDAARGGWGIVAVDDITFADAPARRREAPVNWLDYGTDNYAGVTWSNVPERDGRTLFIGWMSNWKYAQVVPTERWRSAMTLVRTLSLKRTARGFEVYSSPVSEVRSLRTGSRDLFKGSVVGERVLADNIDADAFELTLDITAGKQDVTELVLSNEHDEQVVFRVDAANNRYMLDRSASGAGVLIDACREVCDREVEDKLLDIQTIPFRHGGQVLSLHMIVDHSSIEVFINDGETAITTLVFPTQPYNRVEVRTDSVALVDDAKLHHLTSIWGEVESDE